MPVSYFPKTLKSFLLPILILGQAAHSSLLANEQLISKITFGSCLHQDKPQPIWEALDKEKSDLFIFMGDNIYADTNNINVMHQKYNKLAKQPGYKKFRSNTPIIATWDDHDYGKNDAGKEFPIKSLSKNLFLDFFEVPNHAKERTRSGIYSAHYFEKDNKKLQILLLDTRYFRSKPIKLPTNSRCDHTHYGKQIDPQATILGKQQWRWLENELTKPAALRIIVSSIQVIPEQHCWEKWSNFPHERERFFNLLLRTKADNVIILSGDRHLAEVSKIDIAETKKPIYEITSSGMNTRMYGEGEKNHHRVNDDNFRENNYGVININWDTAPPTVNASIVNYKGTTLYDTVISLD